MFDQGRAERDKILAKHQSKEIVRYLEYRLFNRCTVSSDPVSANEARLIYDSFRISGLDKRIFGGVFVPSRWERVGESVSPSCHRRPIRTFRPKLEPQILK